MGGDSRDAEAVGEGSAPFAAGVELACCGRAPSTVGECRWGRVVRRAERRGAWLVREHDGEEGAAAAEDAEVAEVAEARAVPTRRSGPRPRSRRTPSGALLTDAALTSGSGSGSPPTRAPPSRPAAAVAAAAE